ncbi:MAG: hypothetical protein JXM79_08640 [Sedimentisphaerales bacterium]|nr:hypothetical protein [Sedimentisphaerales bacterium]
MILRTIVCEQEMLDVAYCEVHGKPYAKTQTCPDCQKQAETDIYNNAYDQSLFFRRILPAY